MTELEIFAEITLKHGGEWWRLEKSKMYSLYMCKTRYEVNGRIFYNPPVYQIFAYNGRRVFASTDRKAAYGKFESLCKGDVI